MRLRHNLAFVVFVIAISAASKVNAQNSNQRDHTLKWYGLGIVSALFDPTPGVKTEALKLPQSGQALSEIEFDPQKTSQLAEMLLSELDKSDDPSIKFNVVTALSQLNVGPELKDRIVRSLIARLWVSGKRSDVVLTSPYDFRANVIQALVRMPLLSDQQAEAIAGELLKRMNSADGDPLGTVRGAAAQALSELKGLDPQTRSKVFDSLLDKLNTANDNLGQVRAGAVNALARLALGGDVSQRDRIKNRLSQIRNPATEAYGQLVVPIAAALRDIDPSDPTFSSSILRSQLQVLANRQAPNIVGAVQLLGEITSPDKELESAVTTALTQVMNDVSAYFAARPAAATALGNLNLDDSTNAAAANALINIIKSKADFSPRANAALAIAKFALHDKKRQESAIDALIGLLNDGSNSDLDDPRAAAAKSLTRMNIEDPRRRDLVLTSLLEIAARKPSGPYDSLTQTAVSALGRFVTPGSSQAKSIVHTILEHAGHAGFEEVVPSTLLNFGPLDADQLLQLLKSMGEDARTQQRTAFWRARLLALTGGTQPPQPNWVFVEFLGRKSIIQQSEPAINRDTASQYLKQLNDYWPSIAASEELKTDAARTVLRLIDQACPVALKKSEGDFSGLLQDALADGKLTIDWILSAVGLQSAPRCWTLEQLAILNNLKKNVEGDAQLGNFKGLLAQQMEQERRIPKLGLAVAGYVLWLFPTLLVFLAFPHVALVRRLFLFNDTCRNVLSLGWVTILLHTSSLVRARLVNPFREDLLSDARLSEFSLQYWFADSVVRTKQGKHVPITTALKEVNGNNLLIGESGLGKSTYLRVIAARSKRPVAFLDANSCEKGVLEAIVKRMKGVQDASFIKSMIEYRDLVVIIDGLNEASPDVRAGIIGFANEYRRADIIIATQPIEAIDLQRSPLTNAVAYELCPLAHDDIERFLITRPSRDDPVRRVIGSDYDKAVRSFIEAAIANSQTLEEREAAQLILSNPLDLTYAAELLSQGEMPRPTELIGQAFQLACETYEARAGNPFPKIELSQKTIELRLTNRNCLYPEEMPNVQTELKYYRLMVPRTLYGKDGKGGTGLYFRHDRVWDFLMQIAFVYDPALQLLHLDDSRFRGVYLLFAQTADLATARRLRDLVVGRAAETLDHTLSDEFVRRLATRDPLTKRRKRSH